MVSASARAAVCRRPEAAGAVAAVLLKQKGLDAGAVKAVDLAVYKEEQYDRLADLVRRSLDMKKVYEILDQGV